MSGIRKGLICTGMAAAAIALAACGQQKSGAWQPLKITVEQAEADLEALRTSTFTMKADGAADIASVVSALPDPVSITWDALTFDAASGATVLTGVKVSAEELPDIGVAIDDVRLWGFDTEFALARLKGERLTEAAPLVRRIEANGVSLFGLETVFGPMMDAYTGAIEDVVVDQITGSVTDPDLQQAFRDEFAAGPNLQISKYDFRIGRIIVDDAVLRPYVLAPVQLDESNPFAEAMPFLQGYAAISRSFAADSVGYFDMGAEFAMSEAEMEMDFAIRMDAYGMRGWRGGDTDVAVMKGLGYDADMAVPVFAAALDSAYLESDELYQPPEMIPMSMSMSVDRYSVEGMRLDKLLDHLARGVMPPRTLTDLMSIGVFRSSDERIAMNGVNIYSVAESVMEAKDFHWLVPTRLRFGASNVVFDIAGMFNLVQTFEPSALQSDAEIEMIRQGFELAAKYGLDKPSMDFDVLLDWNPKTGASRIATAGGLDGYMHGDFRFDGVLPSFDAVSKLIPDNPEDADGEAVTKLFADTAGFKGLELNFVDEGGLEKAFALAAEYIATAPPGDQTVAMLRNAGPDGLRQMAVNGILLLGSEAGRQLPQAKPLIVAIAEFVGEGGKLRYLSAPSKTLGQSAIEPVANDPAALFDLLNLTATQTPPKTPR